MRPIFLGFGLGVFLAGCGIGNNTATLPPCVETDCNCSDFATQAEAQRVFDAFPNDVHQLDGDGNGIACESLPRGSGETTAAIDGTRSPHAPFGLPSNPRPDQLNNLLLTRDEYVTAYNCSTGTPNWVAWELTPRWLGSADRQDDFRPDPELPQGCYAVRPTDYRGSGYDRGHVAPSADRTASAAINSATFVMSNMIPQAPENNRETWRELEEYTRELVRSGKVLYVVAGGEGQLKTIADGQVTVPTHTWKVIVAVDRAGAEISTETQVIAVRIPNNETANDRDWQAYRVTVDELEQRLGYDFFSSVPQSVQRAIESRR